MTGPSSAAAPKMPILASRAFRRPPHRVRPRQRAPSRWRPARRRHPACRAGSRRRAACGRPPAARAEQRPAPQPQAGTRCARRRRRASRLAVDRCRSRPDRRSRFRRWRSCSPSPRIGRRRWPPAGRGWCRPNRRAFGWRRRAWPSGASGSRGSRARARQSTGGGATTLGSTGRAGVCEARRLASGRLDIRPGIGAADMLALVDRSTHVSSRRKRGRRRQ